MSYLNQQGWKVAYDVNFAALSTQNLRTGGNGTKTIDGKSWTWANDGNANTATLTNGTGLVCNPLANVSSGNPITRTGPMLHIPVDSLLANGLNIVRHRIRVMIKVALTAATLSAQGVRLGIEDAGAPTDQAFNIFKGFNAGSNSFVYQSAKPTAAQSANVTDTSTFTDDVLVIDWDPPFGWGARTGAFGSDFPAAYSGFRFSEYMDTGNPSPTIRLRAEPRIALIWQDNNAGGGGFTGTIARMRVLLQEKFPF